MATKEQLAKISFLGLDVDGVLTDGSIIIGQEGELSKHFDARDGMGISLALRHGIQIALITGRHSEIVLHRAMELGISSVYENVTDKAAVLKKAASEQGISSDGIAFMGDDLNDLPAFGQAALSFAPADAAEEVRQRADYTARACGGHGAVREVIEAILKAKGLWQQIVESYVQKGQGDKQ